MGATPGPGLNAPYGCSKVQDYSLCFSFLSDENVFAVDIFMRPSTFTNIMEDLQSLLYNQKGVFRVKLKSRISVKGASHEQLHNNEGSREVLTESVQLGHSIYALHAMKCL